MGKTIGVHKVGGETPRNMPNRKGAPMTNRLAVIFFVAMFLIAVDPSSAQAQYDEASTLKGISAVYVLVENLPDGAKVLGLTNDTIQTDVELKLRLAGMRVVPHGEGFKLSGAPHLYVRVTVTPKALAASVAVMMSENALLERNGQSALSAITWERSSVLANPSGQDIRDNTKDLVDDFLNAWLSTNPKK